MYICLCLGVTTSTVQHAIDAGARSTKQVAEACGAGSVCGRGLSGKPWSTIGFEKQHNQAFMIENEAEFVRFMVAEIPPAPPEAAKIRAANSGLPAVAA